MASSMKEVAELAGVSTATVSHVLRGTKRVSAPLRARVRAAAQELGYVPNLQASALRTGRSQMFGVLVPDLSNPFFPALLSALSPAARATGRVLLVHEAENDPELELLGLRRLLAARVDGLIWVPVGEVTPGAMQRVRPRSGMPPLVTIDRAVPGADAVVADHEAGGALQARHLITLGRTRAVLLSGPTAVPAARARREGFLKAFSPLRPVWEAVVGFGHELSGNVAEELARGGFDSVVCPNDAAAVGVARALKRAGFGVPGEVSVIGFDDVPWAALMDPPLTTVRQPLEDLGAAAVELLLKRMRTPQREPSSVVLPVELIARDSTALLARAAEEQADREGEPHNEVAGAAKEGR